MSSKRPLRNMANILFSVLLFALLCPVFANAGPASGRYVINLASEVVPFEDNILASIEAAEGTILYTTTFEKDGLRWYRLRLGFFSGATDAKLEMDNFIKKFPDAWVAKAAEQEWEKALLEKASATAMIASPIPPPSSPSAPAPAPAVTVPVPVGRETLAKAPSEPKRPTFSKPEGPDASQRLAEADLVMAEKNYARAIQLYTKLSKDEDVAVREPAQQKLGLAREYNGQLAHAKAEYRRYLTLYPAGDAAQEVRKRLDNLQKGGRPARVSQNGQPGAKASEQESFWRKDFHGSLSEFYYRNESKTDAGGNVVSQSSFNTDLDFNLRLRSEDLDIQTVFVGGHEEDLLEDGDSRTRISSGYVNLIHKPSGHAARLGRQTRSSGGVLGRFDGALLGFQLMDKVRMNLVGGFPVQSSTRGLETDKRFYGVSFDLGTLADHWDFNTFIINQETEGITDRRAVGGEVRYFHPRGTFFSLVDYDISYRELNTFLAVGSMTLPTETMLNFSVDYRQSPSLTTSNALIGQLDASLDQLLDDLGEDAVRDLARDRTALSRSVTLGITQPINQKLQVAADVSWSNLEGTKASGGVEEIQGSGDEYYYSLQLIGNSLIREGDLAIFGLRYGDTATSDIYSVNLNTRYPLTRDWRINPRLVVDFRKNRETDTDQLKFRPSLRTDYRWNKNLNFELEGGMEWTSNSEPDQEDDDTRGFFVIAGLRFHF